MCQKQPCFQGNFEKMILFSLEKERFQGKMISAFFSFNNQSKIEEVWDYIDFQDNLKMRLNHQKKTNDNISEIIPINSWLHY